MAEPRYIVQRLSGHANPQTTVEARDNRRLVSYYILDSFYNYKQVDLVDSRRGDDPEQNRIAHLIALKRCARLNEGEKCRAGS